jgi:hypothetical protein
MRIALPLLVAIVFPTSGCLSDVVPMHGAPSDADVQRILATAAYRGSGFAQVNAQPYATGLDQTDTVDMFVSVESLDAYATIAPELTHVGRGFPVGGMVVREPHDASGAVKVLTVMVKEPAGYTPDVGDFLFGVTTPDGKPVVDPTAGTLWGQLAECGGCHTKRAGDAYLFGVPMSNRSAIAHP